MSGVGRGGVEWDEVVMERERGEDDVGGLIRRLVDEEVD